MTTGLPEGAEAAAGGIPLVSMATMLVHLAAGIKAPTATKNPGNECLGGFPAVVRLFISWASFR